MLTATALSAIFSPRSGTVSSGQCAVLVPHIHFPVLVKCHEEIGDNVTVAELQTRAISSFRAQTPEHIQCQSNNFIFNISLLGGESCTADSSKIMMWIQTSLLFNLIPFNIVLHETRSSFETLKVLNCATSVQCIKLHGARNTMVRCGGLIIFGCTAMKRPAVKDNRLASNLLYLIP